MLCVSFLLVDMRRPKWRHFIVSSVGLFFFFENDNAILICDFHDNFIIFMWLYGSNWYLCIIFLCSCGVLLQELCIDGDVMAVNSTYNGSIISGFDHSSVIIPNKLLKNNRVHNDSMTYLWNRSLRSPVAVYIQLDWADFQLSPE